MEPFGRGAGVPQRHGQAVSGQVGVSGDLGVVAGEALVIHEGAFQEQVGKLGPQLVETGEGGRYDGVGGVAHQDRKSTRLKSSHLGISYAVFFFNDTATTEIYTLSLHDALPIWSRSANWVRSWLRRVR